ncbi:MAG: FAD-binding protein [Bacteroidetes bacterium]|nr:FAD-binding protein [Bacteroidota bacterium]
MIATNETVWINRHETFRQPVRNLYDMANGDTGNMIKDYNATTTAIQSLLAQAMTEGVSVRALGGGWSFSQVAATDGWLLNTKQLNMLFNISPASIHPNYTGRKDQLLFAQCGNSVQELNNYLRTIGKSLRTSGASNGQTIVGAFSTGTHGAAIDTGATQDFVAGLHIIVAPDRHIWLERASYPVASDILVQKLDAELVRDDDLFNAALVSFGSFGFIHGVMIETEPLYLLECYRRRMPLDARLKKVMETLDFSAADFPPYGNERPFHFQLVVDQYDLDGGAYVTTMYKRPYKEGYQPPVSDPNKAGPGDDVPAFLGRATDLIPDVTPLIVSYLIKNIYGTFPDTGLWGVSGEIFSNTDTRGRVLSMAMGLPVSYTNQANDLLLELNKKHGPFTGVFSYRYVKGSAATLAFTRFSPTCVLELDGVESSITRKFYDVVLDAFEANNIPFTFHWGKINMIDNARILRMYGDAVDKWLNARNTLLRGKTLGCFCNQLLKDWGLDKTVTPQLRPF